ncbi:hypothetical protein NDU88_004848 [Pleurodeles waltl]|uniref:Uncharacterized protein n=1 Tax=Pleurodeles waltl TaxID=8319 RepID=A0AAV7TSF5_PLEWA|nr:hypothetical protein NDU88_004848 [Pleurodeles waltl]
MILIVETARELMEALMKEIQSLEDELKTQDSLQEAKKQIEAINQELESFNLYLVKRKTDKLRKDIRWFTKERAYPYLSEKYYVNQQQNVPEQDRQFWTNKKIVTFSDTPESEGEGNSNQFEQYSVSILLIQHRSVYSYDSNMATVSDRHITLYERGLAPHGIH